jgi:hypothetical protein
MDLRLVDGGNLDVLSACIVPLQCANIFILYICAVRGAPIRGDWSDGIRRIRGLIEADE